jgi:hypothetical protein
MARFDSQKPTLHSLPDHRFHGVEQESAGNFRLSEFARPIEVVPGDLERAFKECVFFFHA